MTAVRWLLALMLLAGSRADALVVVATGDSLTGGYFSYLSADTDLWYEVASGGTAARRYVGLEPDPHQGNELHDFRDDVLALDPDIIVFMLGTNDAIRGEPWFDDEFAPLITGVLDEFAASGAAVIVAIPIPIIAPQYADADARLEELYRPWLSQEAEARGFAVLDLYAEIQLLPFWQELYNDGIHLWANDAEGYRWLAARVEQAVIEVPEPSWRAAVAAAVAALGFLRRRRHPAVPRLPAASSTFPLSKRETAKEAFAVRFQAAK